jgi:hypothetical protein
MAYVKSLSEVPYLSKKGLQDRYFLYLKYKEKTMAEKKFKQVCKCENCGNEAEMMITCSLEEHEEKPTGMPYAATVATRPTCGLIFNHNSIDYTCFVLTTQNRYKSKGVAM